MGFFGGCLALLVPPSAPFSGWFLDSPMPLGSAFFSPAGFGSPFCGGCCGWPFGFESPAPLPSWGGPFCSAGGCMFPSCFMSLASPLLSWGWGWALLPFLLSG